MIRLLESFDPYSTAFLPAGQLWDSASGVTITPDAGRSGFTGDNAAFFSTESGSVLRKTISPTIHAGLYTVTYGFAIRPLICELTAIVFSLLTANSQFDLQMTEWGSLELFQTTGGNPLGRVCQSPDGIVPIGTGGIYIEIQFIQDVNLERPITILVSDQFGTMMPVASGAYLSPLISPPSTEVVFGGGVGERPAMWYLDDVYMTDGVPAITPVNYQGRNVYNNSFLGNTHITTFYMTADGAAQTTGNLPWVPDTGSVVFDRIDEHPPDEDASYVSADTTDQRSTGLFQAPTAAPFGRQGCCAFAPIFGMEWLGRLRTLGTDGTVVPVIRRVSGGTFATDVVEVGDTIAVSGEDYVYYPQILERDPTNNNEPFTFAVFYPAGVGVPGTVELGIQKTD